jgi:proteic killer suppression protein
VIESFKHKGLKRLYEDDDRSGLGADMVEKIENILTLLDAARTPERLNAPSFRLHQLTGDRKGFWSVTVRANWRIIFKFRDGNAYDVELIDYH